MKIVINDCYGGFGLSNDAILRYAELKGVTLYPEGGKYSATYWLVPPEERTGMLYNDAFYEAPLNARQESNRRYGELTVDFTDIARDDVYLVQVVQELKEASDGNAASLKIVEIPDGVNWEIAEYDGIETIEEVHRSWR